MTGGDIYDIPEVRRKRIKAKTREVRNAKPVRVACVTLKPRILQKPENGTSLIKSRTKSRE
jgi:hypothetical protein